MAAQNIKFARAAFVRERPVCATHLQGMVIRRGWRAGKGFTFFWGCPRYPECKPTKALTTEELDRLAPILPRSTK